VRKRLADHFNLLRRKIHPNKHLQNAFNLYGEKSFSSEIEVICEDASDLDDVEMAFLLNSASFEGPTVYNIARHSCVGMTGRHHTKESIEKIRRSKIGQKFTDEQKLRLKLAHVRSLMSDERFMAKVRTVIDTYDRCRSYAETARKLGLDTSSVRKMYLKWKDYSK